jgi:hypothetical protein
MSISRPPEALLHRLELHRNGRKRDGHFDGRPRRAPSAALAAARCAWPQIAKSVGSSCPPPQDGGRRRRARLRTVASSAPSLAAFAAAVPVQT